MTKTPSYLLDCIKRYQHSEKGRETRQKYLDANKDKLSQYHKDYSRKRREEARAKKICARCFRRSVVEGRTLCKACLERGRSR